MHSLNLRLWPSRFREHDWFCTMWSNLTEREIWKLMQKLITKELKRLILYYHKETNIFAAVEKVSSPCKTLATIIYIIWLIYNFHSGFYNRHRRQHEIDQKTNEMLNSMFVLAHKEPTPDHPIFETLSTIFRQSIEENIKVRLHRISSRNQRTAWCELVRQWTNASNQLEPSCAWIPGLN